MAAVVAAAPTVGCSESHPASGDAGTANDDAPTGTDAAIAVDAGSVADVALAIADAFPPDAASWDDPDAPDTGYPDGVRG